MTQRHKIQLFEEKKVRTAWDDQEEKWYFSIVDVCGVLTDSKDPQAYWRKLKQRLKDEGNETVMSRFEDACLPMARCASLTGKLFSQP